MNDKTHVLFLCTGNSCRSQMAEGLCRHIKGTGIETHGLNPSAVKVMSEIGIDISRHHSKTANELYHQQFDYVVTVCGHANETCPDFATGTTIVHHEFDDPPKLALHETSEEQALNHYRRVWDEIKDYIQTLPNALN